MLITTPKGAVTIRPAQEADALAFRDLRLEALQNHQEAFSADHAANLAKPLTEWGERLRSHQRDDLQMIWFATCSEKLIGMSGIYRGDSLKTRHNATIWGVYVQPAWRGLHIAEGLLAACLEWARTHGVTNVKLAVVTTNTAAIRCYARLGFRAYGVEPQAIYYNATFYDELLMIKSI